MRISAIHVRALAEAVGSTRALGRASEGTMGVSSQAFLERTQTAARLSDPYGWFSVEEFDALLSLALELTQDEAFGLHWGEHSPMMQFDVLPPLISQAKSLQEAIGAVLRF